MNVGIYQSVMPIHRMFLIKLSNFVSPLSCPTLCDTMHCGPWGFSVHGILQARILQWGDISFSRGSFWPRDWTQVSHAGRFFVLAIREAKILKCMQAKSLQLCLTLTQSQTTYGLYPTRLLCPWDSPPMGYPPGKNSGVSGHFLLQQIFLTQEWNPYLLHWQAGSLPLVPSSSLN